MNRTDFIASLEKQLLRLPKAARDDILNDFDAHFDRGLEEGKSEDVICAELGDPAELAKSYLENLPEGSKGAPYIQPEGTDEETAEPADDSQTASASQTDAPFNTGAQSRQQYVYTAPAGSATAVKRDRSGEIVAVVLLTVFAAIPIFGSIIGAWFGGVGLVAAFFAAAIAMFIGGGASMAGSVVGGIGLILIGAAMLCLAALTILGMIAAVKGIVWLIKWYIGICKKIINGGEM